MQQRNKQLEGFLRKLQDENLILRKELSKYTGVVVESDAASRGKYHLSNEASNASNTLLFKMRDGMGHIRLHSLQQQQQPSQQPQQQTTPLHASVTRVNSVLGISSPDQPFDESSSNDEFILRLAKSEDVLSTRKDQESEYGGPASAPMSRIVVRGREKEPEETSSHAEGNTSVSASESDSEHEGRTLYDISGSALLFHHMKRGVEKLHEANIIGGSGIGGQSKIIDQDPLPSQQQPIAVDAGVSTKPPERIPSMPTIVIEQPQEQEVEISTSTPPLKKEEVSGGEEKKEHEEKDREKALRDEDESLSVGVDNYPKKEKKGSTIIIQQQHNSSDKEAKKDEGEDGKETKKEKEKSKEKPKTPRKKRKHKEKTAASLIMSGPTVTFHGRSKERLVGESGGGVGGGSASANSSPKRKKSADAGLERRRVRANSVSPDAQQPIATKREGGKRENKRRKTMRTDSKFELKLLEFLSEEEDTANGTPATSPEKHGADIPKRGSARRQTWAPDKRFALKKGSKAAVDESEDGKEKKKEKEKEKEQEKVSKIHSKEREKEDRKSVV